MDGSRARRYGVENSTSQTLRILALLGLLGTFSGCTSLGGTSFSEWVGNGFKVGHNYRKPVAPANADWVGRYPDDTCPCDDCEPGINLPTFTTDYDECAAWWNEAFGDQILNELIATAYQQNLDLERASFRVLQARALRDVAVGGLFPQSQTNSGSYTRSQMPGRANAGAWSLGFALAWEVDVWGKLRRNVEIADANIDASVEDYDAVLLMLISDVATTYVEIRTLQERIAIACDSLATQKPIVGSWKTNEVRIEQDLNRRALETDPLQLVPLQRELLQVKLVAAQAETTALETHTKIAAYRLSLAQAQNRLSVLLGMPPQDLGAMLGDNAKEALTNRKSVIPCAAVCDVGVGVPAELMRRRPDVRAAERAVAAQSAAVGVAVAELYPAFSIGGNVSWAGPDFDDIFQGSNLSGSVGPSFNWNILNYGRLRGAIGNSEALLGQRIIDYQSAVLNAQLEVENALAAYARQYQAVQLLQRSSLVAKAAGRQELQGVKTLQGANQNPIAPGQVLDAATLSTLTLFTVPTQLRNSDDLAQARQALAVSFITLQRALGGGWQLRCNPAYEQPTRFSHMMFHPNSTPNMPQPIIPLENVPPFELLPGDPSMQ